MRAMKKEIELKVDRKRVQSMSERLFYPTVLLLFVLTSPVIAVWFYLMFR